MLASKESERAEYILSMCGRTAPACAVSPEKFAQRWRKLGGVRAITFWLGRWIHAARSPPPPVGTSSSTVQGVSALTGVVPCSAGATADRPSGLGRAEHRFGRHMHRCRERRETGKGGRR